MGLPGKNTGVGFHFLLQGIFPTQGLNPCPFCLLQWHADSTTLYHLGSPDQFLNKVNFSTHAMGLHLPHREMSHNSPIPEPQHDFIEQKSLD